MRSILCPTCAEKFHEHPDDVAEGWRMRKVHIKVKRPTDGSHQISILSGGTEEIIPVPMVVCDHCNTELPDGTDAVAVSMWQGVDPGNWEKEYSQ